MFICSLHEIFSLFLFTAILLSRNFTSKKAIIVLNAEMSNLITESCPLGVSVMSFIFKTLTFFLC